MPEQTKQFAISEQLLYAIGNYLSNRPYREVANLVAELNQLKPVAQPQPEQTPGGA